MAEAEQAPLLPPVLAEIPARVQALDNPLPRAPEAELVQPDQAAPANELAQPVEVLVLLAYSLEEVVMSVFLCACFPFSFVRGSLPSSLSCSSGRALVCRVVRAFCQFLFRFFRSFHIVGFSSLFLTHVYVYERLG